MEDFYCGSCGCFRPAEDHQCPTHVCPVCGAEEGKGYYYRWNLGWEDDEECSVCGLYTTGYPRYDPRHDRSSRWYERPYPGYGDDGWEL